MNYQHIFKDDLINGEGVRVSLFVSGCSHGCENCFSPHTWDYRSGSLFTDEVLNELFTALDKPYISGLSLLGGDPLAPKNTSTVIDICKKFKERFPEKNIWCWTGYTLEEVQNNHAKDILEYCDVLIDGKFVQELKDLTLPFRGSSNQRILKKGENF